MWRSDLDYFNFYRSVWIYFYLVFLTDLWDHFLSAASRRKISRIWNIYVKRVIASKDFTATAHTRVWTISMDSIGFRERECRTIMSRPQISRYQTVSAFASPRYERPTQKPGLNARHGNFSTISQARLWDLRYTKRSKVSKKFSRDLKISASIIA